MTPSPSPCECRVIQEGNYLNMSECNVKIEYCDNHCSADRYKAERDEERSKKFQATTERNTALTERDEARKELVMVKAGRYTAESERVRFKRILVIVELERDRYRAALEHLQKFGEDGRYKAPEQLHGTAICQRVWDIAHTALNQRQENLYHCQNGHGLPASFCSKCLEAQRKEFIDHEPVSYLQCYNDGKVAQREADAKVAEQFGNKVAATYAKACQDRSWALNMSTQIATAIRDMTND